MAKKTEQEVRAPLSPMEEAFCQAYVANGGHGVAAAKAAGYATPNVDGCKVLMRGKVADRIRQLTSLDITSRLGRLVEIAWEIANDDAQTAKDRLKAVEMLLDRGGLAVPRGNNAPSVAVQVNVATTAADAQAAIKEIWHSRTARQKALAMGEQEAEQPAQLEHSVQMIDNAGFAGGVSYVGHGNSGDDDREA